MGRQDIPKGYSTAQLTKEERAEYAMEVTKNVALGKKNQNNALQKSNYLDDDNVRQFHKIIRRKSLFANRTCLNSPEQMNKEIEEYFELCDEYHTVPVITGLASYLGLNKSYMYQLANSDSEMAPSIKKAISFVEELMESATLRNAVNPVSFIFLAKNWFNMSDSQTITIKPEDPNAVNKTDTLNALQEVIAEQDKVKLIDTKSE